MAQTLSPLQMGSMQSQQTAPLQGLNEEAVEAPLDLNRLAEQGLYGGEVPWGDLYSDLQKNYWTNMIRDPDSGEIAKVRVRDYIPGTTSPISSEATTPPTYSDWSELSLLDYLKDLSKYKTPIYDPGPDGTYVHGMQQAPLYDGPLAEYFMNMTSPTQNLRGSEYDKGDALLDYFNQRGIDTQSKIDPYKAQNTNDYTGISSRALESYLNESRNNPNATGSLSSRWFADNPEYSKAMAQSDTRGIMAGVKGNSVYETIKPLVSDYANTLGQPFDPNKDPNYSSWTNYRDKVNEAVRAEDKAFNRQAIGAFLSVFAPAIAPQLGAGMGLSGTAANVAGGALYGAGSSALTGGNPLTGAVTGGLGGAFSSLVPGSFAGVDAANLINQGITGSQLSALLQQSGTAAGTAGLYGALSSIGLTNPAWVTGAQNLIKSGTSSALSGKPFDPRSALKSTAMSQLPSGVSAPLSLMALR